MRLTRLTLALDAFSPHSREPTDVRAIRGRANSAAIHFHVRAPRHRSPPPLVNRSREGRSTQAVSRPTRRHETGRDEATRGVPRRAEREQVCFCFCVTSSATLRYDVCATAPELSEVHLCEITSNATEATGGERYVSVRENDLSIAGRAKRNCQQCHLQSVWARIQE